MMQQAKILPSVRPTRVHQLTQELVHLREPPHELT